jgi:hypothetical protein
MYLVCGCIRSSSDDVIIRHLCLPTGLRALCAATAAAAAVTRDVRVTDNVVQLCARGVCVVCVVVTDDERREGSHSD